MQRSQPLIPLSHDHHHGLVVSRRIGEGLKRGIEPARMAAYLRYFWDSDLKRHFVEEEDIIFPLLAADDTMVLRAKEEHIQLRDYIAALRSNAQDLDKLASFAKGLEAHIRFEERELFPHIERTALPAALARAGAGVRRDADAPECWDDAFWKA